MKYLILMIAVIVYWSCTTDSEFTSVGRETLKNKTDIDLLYRGGGATAPDIIWVQKTLDNKKNFIGKIKWHNGGYSTKIWQINDSLIKVRLIDTSIWKGKYRDFTLSLNNQIHFNDGSMFADSTY